MQGSNARKIKQNATLSTDHRTTKRVSVMLKSYLLDFHYVYERFTWNIEYGVQFALT